MNATPIQFTFETAHTERDQLELSKLIQRLETAERELAEQAKRFHDEIADRQKTEAANRELNLKERDALRARVAELEQDKQRLDWLERGKSSLETWSWSSVVNDGPGFTINGHYALTIRAAIDAARAT